MKYRHITVRIDTAIGPYNGHPVYSIDNNRSGQSLGNVLYYAPWKRWVARFDDDSVWSDDCLADVRDFIGRLARGEAAR